MQIGNFVTQGLFGEHDSDMFINQYSKLSDFDLANQFIVDDFLTDAHDPTIDQTHPDAYGYDEGREEFLQYINGQTNIFSYQ